MTFSWAKAKQDAVDKKVQNVETRIKSAMNPSKDNDSHRKTMLAEHPDWMNAAKSQASLKLLLDGIKQDIIKKQQKYQDKVEKNFKNVE